MYKKNKRGRSPGTAESCAVWFLFHPPLKFNEEGSEGNAKQHFIRLFHFFSGSIKKPCSAFSVCNHLITASERDVTPLFFFFLAGKELSRCGWLHTQAQERGLWALALAARRPGDEQLEQSAGTDTLWVGLRPRMWFTRRFFRVSRGLNLVSGLCKQRHGHVGVEEESNEVEL